MTDDSFLQGVKVVDFTRAFAGPICTMILAEMGADVIKIEDPSNPDETRSWPPFLTGGLSGYYSALNRSKRSITIDLKSADGARIARGLSKQADIVVENYRPGVAARLRVDYDSLRSENAGLVYCSISGFGQSGPYKNRRGYDPVLQAMGGLMGVTGEEGGGPIKSMIPVADFTSGLFAAIAILAALHRRQVTGEGEYLDTSMLDVMVALTSTVGSGYLNSGRVPSRAGTRNPARVPSAAFECADGVWIQLVPNQRQWPRFCQAIGEPGLATDPDYVDNDARIAHQKVLYPFLDTVFALRPSTEWLPILLEAGIAAGPIYTLDALFADPQVIARGLVEEVVHPESGSFNAITLPIRGRNVSARINRHPPSAGEHTVEVLRDSLGLPDSEIGRLIEAGAVSIPDSVTPQASLQEAQVEVGGDPE